MNDEIIAARSLSVTYQRRRGRGGYAAVKNVDLAVRAGETVGLVGESGSGKSTLGKALLGLVSPTAGAAEFRGRAVDTLRGADLRAFRQQVQVVFQDPGQSLNPKKTVGRALMEVIRLHQKAARGKESELACSLLERVGLKPATSFMIRRPHELSGGQKQRVAIARAIAVEPAVIVADEALSALDVSVQKQILDLMIELQRDLGVGYLFISHDMDVVREICSRAAVMYRGEIVESADVDRLFGAPQHEYTRTLLDARMPVVPHMTASPNLDERQI